MKHELKMLPKFFEKVSDGTKTFEVRFNDRNFKVGDHLILREYENGEYTGNIVYKIITYILNHHEFDGLKENYVVLGIKNDY